MERKNFCIQLPLSKNITDNDTSYSFTEIVETIDSKNYYLIVTNGSNYIIKNSINSIYDGSNTILVEIKKYNHKKEYVINFYDFKVEKYQNGTQLVGNFLNSFSSSEDWTSQPSYNLSRTLNTVFSKVFLNGGGI